MSKMTYTVTAFKKQKLLRIPKYVSYIGTLFIIWCFYGKFVFVSVHLVQVLQYPDCCCFQMGEGREQIRTKRKDNKNYHSQTLHICNVSSRSGTRLKLHNQPRYML